MRDLKVYIEIDGKQRLVGNIFGDSYKDARFNYHSDYLKASYAAPISISLPLTNKEYSSDETRCFFESILPEGFSRKAVADWIKTDEKDYITILSVLGKECLGAIRIIENEEPLGAHYEKLSKRKVRELASEGATTSTRILLETHLSLAGASGKVGLYLGDDKKWYLPKGDAPSTYIVKQSHVRFNKIVTNEQLCMLTAKMSDIEVPDSFIVDGIDDNEESVLFATKRFDRIANEKKMIDGHFVPYRIHQEDFAQAMGIFSEQKYEKEKIGYMKGMFDILRAYSSNPIEDQRKLLEIIVFNYLIGNTDGHIKNFSLLYGYDLKSMRLAPAYDIVATRVYETTSRMSFYIGNDIDIENITRSSFVDASSEIGLGRRFVENVFDNLANAFEENLNNATYKLSQEGFDSAKDIKTKILNKGGYALI